MSQSGNDTSKKKKSLMWRHFKKTEEKGKVICNLCKQEYKFCNNTSNMKDHLHRKHPEVLLQLPNCQDTDEVEIKDPQCRNLTTKYDQNSSRKKMLDNLFVNMIAIDMEPLRLSEREGLKEFVAGLDSRYEMPGRTNVTSKLTKLYMKKKIQLMKIIEEARYMAITADTWTSNSNKGILGLTCHFIRENKLVSGLLAAKVVEGHHDADHLSSVSITFLTNQIKNWLPIQHVCIQGVK